MEHLTHVDTQGQARMVDVVHKDVTLREARAETLVLLPPKILKELQNGELYTKKGAVFQTAIIAGTMAAKKTYTLIPLCHPLAVEGIDVTIQLNQEAQVVIESKVRIHHKTGVEMEALTACTVAALTIYDMCKAMSHEITIAQTRLIAKTGGKCDYHTTPTRT